ncbi:DUF2244 domain-containing protein [Aliiroseovarius sp. F20344]|uniref:DUF2244 domain-containing protein n=1 Tax=Aliiroseovarius sp. F20344 TaxID=2926414 RepID=UPI001FF5E700|nr:DUF2244 domain-containing protein [Aliiroseovarius sp. F20344]MCK0141951.1 DUF2244 domain-containing protein [Aliiroseovarius sp. F20344]
MPYEWVQADKSDAQRNRPKAELHLWPYRSLPRRGFVWIMGMGFGMMALPLLAFLGTVALWGLLPFGLAALGALWFFIEKSYKDGEILEELRIWSDHMTLTRHGPRGEVQKWEGNPYWVTVQLHKSGGPVPDYVTLKGSGREVELGAFLSEDERPALHAELSERLMQIKSHQ